MTRVKIVKQVLGKGGKPRKGPRYWFNNLINAMLNVDAEGNEHFKVHGGTWNNKLIPRSICQEV